MINPIAPQEVELNVTKPDEVIQVFNDLIQENWDGRKSCFRLKAVADRVSEAMEITLPEVFDRHYLDVEPIYRRIGWRVKYDEPGFNETYPATFTFSKEEKS